MINLKEIVTKARLQFTLNLIAATIVASLNSAKAYADGLKQALVAGDIAFTSQYFNSGTKTDVGSALVELATKANSDAVTFEVLSSPNTGKLKTYRFKKGTGAGATTMDIDIEKDLLNGTFELVTITEGTGADAGKYFDGATEVTSAQGVTKAGVFMKYNSNAAGESPAYSYADMTGLVEYLTLGDQTGKVVTLSIVNHQITADIADGAITKAKLAQAVQNQIDGAAQIIDVNNIKALTNAQCEALRAGDIVNKVDATGKHAYRVSYKTATGMCLTYSDCENVETVAYEKSNDNWAWDSTDVTPIGTALQSKDFDEISEADCTAAWEAAWAAANTPAQSGGEEQNGGE